jgi:hypothetical protein
MEVPTPDEIRKYLDNGRAVIISCALASGPLLKADYLRGFHCVVCGVEVQVSPRGVAQIKAGCIAACNECGIRIAELQQQRGQLGGLALSPESKAALARGRTIMDPRRIDRLVQQSEDLNAQPLRCDFCSGLQPRLWFFPYRSFVLEARKKDGRKQTLVFEAGEWAACDECARLFQIEHIDGLVDRVAKSQGACDRLTRVTYRELLRHRNGPPRLEDLVIHAH